MRQHFRYGLVLIFLGFGLVCVAENGVAAEDVGNLRRHRRRNVGISGVKWVLGTGCSVGRGFFVRGDGDLFWRRV